MNEQEISKCNKRYGTALKTMRLASGMSQAEISEKIGLTYQQVQKYETGTNRIPLYVAESVCNLLGFPTEHFFTAQDINIEHSRMLGGIMSLVNKLDEEQAKTLRAFLTAITKEK